MFKPYFSEWLVRQYFRGWWIGGMAIGSLLLLCGCNEQAGSQSIKDAPSGYGDARFMGTVDGCRLWSVNNGQFYFANCRGGTTSTGYRVQSGKTSHYYTTTADFSED